MKIKHILKATDFSDVFESGEKSHGTIAALYFKRDPNARSLSIGIVISKKFVPKAVTRNYMRRLIYAYFRGNGEKMEPNTKIVVRITQDMRKAKRKQLSKALREELDTLVGKANLVK